MTAFVPPGALRPLLALVLGLALLLPPRPPPLDAEPVPGAPTRLQSGLELLLRPTPGAARTALVLVLRVGERHDPPGRSGLTHLVEHLFVTSPAGPKAPARPFEDLLARYRDGQTAQTSDRHTTIGLVFPPERLEEELDELAARLGTLDIRPADLERERGRVLQEVAQMFEGPPGLTAMNQSREQVVPSAVGGRRAGLPAHVAALTLEEVRAHAARHFRAGQAVLSLAGPFDAAQVRALVEERFGALPPGEPAVETPRAPLPPSPRLKVVSMAMGFDERPRVTLAYAAPPPGHDDYPTFLVLAARLASLKSPVPMNPPAFYFAPLDEPGACYVSRLLEEGEAPESAVARVQKEVNAAVAAPPVPADAFRTTNVFGLLLGLVPNPPQLATANIYVVAMAPAVRHVLGLDPARLQRALAQARTLPTAEVAARVFDPLAAGAAVVTR